MGYIVKSFRWVIVYKFLVEKKKIKIVDIIVEVGRIGIIIFLVIFELVRFVGIIVSRVIFYNEDYIREKDIKINDIVLV